jgi:hypothetical protein
MEQTLTRLPDAAPEVDCVRGQHPDAGHRDEPRHKRVQRVIDCQKHFVFEERQAEQPNIG